MIVLGVILILVGYLLPVPGIIATIGWILLAIGLVLLVPRPDGRVNRAQRRAARSVHLHGSTIFRPPGVHAA